MFRLKTLTILGSKAELASLLEGKLLINTVNAHSFNTAKKDQLFADALTNGDVLIPDGVSIVKACKWIKAKSQRKERIAGWDLFFFEMSKLEKKGGKVMFMGSSQKVLDLIVKRAAVDYPHLKVVTYSPPYKPAFSDEDNKAIIDAINAANPDLLWIGMTAPKQEKWTYSHWNELNIHCHVGTIGAVFDFFAGTVERAPIWWQEHGLEWLYRLIKEPKRMWRRYIIGNTLFLWNMVKDHSFNTAKKDQLFADALTNGDVLIPDGVSIVKACKWIKAKSQRKERIAGWDLFFFEMSKLEKKGGKVMFMGSSQKVLDLIVKRAAVDYPHLKVVTYSPPYKPAFSDEDNKAIIDAINAANPDLLWIGMTAPKQEKWTYSHWNELNIHCHVGTIGAVFDFFAGTVERAPIWWQEHGLEWLYRLIKEPKRMWRRYIIGNTLFLWNMVKE